MQKLIQLSARELGKGFYTEAQRESAIRHIYGVDTQLIDDGAYFLAECEGEIAGCGGWSRRKTLFGGDQMKEREDTPLDPRTEPAKVRAFFVHPDWARRGVGSLILELCLSEALAGGFQSVELMATLPGVPFYLTRGFESREETILTLPDRTDIALVRMARVLTSEDRRAEIGAGADHN